MIEILTGQLIDPFRIGLVFFLLMTALRTRETMGLTMPLAMGVVFIAILLPMTTAADASADKIRAVAMGVLANAIILGVFLLGWLVWLKSKRS
ncbi:hypothetical protein ACFSE1_10735 [Rhizobium helianthi]|uniref:Uncharacterized protein n=1 Tax=Rhizobium helianthi TaxID=1132695 RepID=A0ABW4M5N0_9HYPH